MRIVLDTNIIISALHKNSSNSALIISLFFQKQIECCLTNEIFLEYKNVLNRPKFNYFNKQDVKLFLETIKKQSKWITKKEDSSDNKFLECAVAGNADCIITGDNHLLKLKKYRNITILNPLEFLQHISLII